MIIRSIPLVKEHYQEFIVGRGKPINIINNKSRDLLIFKEDEQSDSRRVLVVTSYIDDEVIKVRNKNPAHLGREEEDNNYLGSTQTTGSATCHWFWRMD